MKLRDHMPELDGAAEWLNGEVSREDLIGTTPALVHFWSVSCRSCKEAITQVNRIQEEYKGSLAIVAVHMPRTEADNSIAAVKEAAEACGMEQPIFIDGGLKLAAAFDNHYVPAYYLFDKEGTLRHFQAGGSGTKLLEKRIARIVAE